METHPALFLRPTPLRDSKEPSHSNRFLLLDPLPALLLVWDSNIRSCCERIRASSFSFASASSFTNTVDGGAKGGEASFDGIGRCGRGNPIQRLRPLMWGRSRRRGTRRWPRRNRAAQTNARREGGGRRRRGQREKRGRVG